MDICELFDEEVTHALDEGWATDGLHHQRDSDSIGGGYTSGGPPRPRDGTGPTMTFPQQRRQFKTLWFDDDLDGDLLGRGREPKRGDKPPIHAGLKGKLNDIYADRDASN